jgi:hypothetical protein
MTANPDPPPTDPHLHQLERRVRWLTAVCVFLGAGLLLVYVRPWIPTLPDLRVKSLMIPDATGTPRLLLGTWGDATPFVQLNDARGRERVMLLVQPDRAAHLHLADSTGRYRVVLELDGAERPALRMGDGHTLTAAVIGRGDGRPVFVALSDVGADTLFAAPRPGYAARSR